MFQPILFDTLAYANKLKQAGMPDKQAEAQAEALIDVLYYQPLKKIRSLDRNPEQPSSD